MSETDPPKSAEVDVPEQIANRRASRERIAALELEIAELKQAFYEFRRGFE